MNLAQDPVYQPFDFIDERCPIGPDSGDRLRRGSPLPRTCSLCDRRRDRGSGLLQRPRSARRDPCRSIRTISCMSGVKRNRFPGRIITFSHSLLVDTIHELAVPEKVPAGTTPRSFPGRNFVDRPHREPIHPPSACIRAHANESGGMDGVTEGKRIRRVALWSASY